MADFHKGSVLIVKRYTRDQLQRNPGTLFVFGDNLARVGRGGQAAETRGEPNSVGIVTKISPSRFLCDEDALVVKAPLVQAFNRLRDHLLSGGNVVWPADGVGTGLAELPSRAPLIHEAIERCRELLFSFAKSVIRE